MLSLRGDFENKFANNDLTEANALLEKAEVKVSFWGGRILTAPGYSGSITLDEVARKTLEVGRRVLEEDSAANIPARLAGVKSCELIQGLYVKSNEQISHSNFFTRLLNYLREFQFEYMKEFMPCSSLPTLFVDKLQDATSDFLAFGEANRRVILEKLGKPLPECTCSPCEVHVPRPETNQGVRWVAKKAQLEQLAGLSS